MIKILIIWILIALPVAHLLGKYLRHVGKGYPER